MEIDFQPAFANFRSYYFRNYGSSIHEERCLTCFYQYVGVVGHKAFAKAYSSSYSNETYHKIRMLSGPHYMAVLRATELTTGVSLSLSKQYVKRLNRMRKLERR